ncbi:MAG: M16 family metallopeptidase [Thermoanaerobaculia bacterium]
MHRRDLNNGARFFVLENRFNPTLALSGGLFAGAIFAPPARRTVASLTAGELMKGTERRTKLEIAEALESRGASLSFSTDSSDLVGMDIGGAALSRDCDTLLDTLVEVLRLPVFPEDEIEKEKKRLVGAIRQQQDQPAQRAYETASRAIYPEGHPFRRRTAEQRIAQLESLTRDELRTFYIERYGAATLQVVVVGDVEAGRILDGLEDRFGDWVGGPGGGVPPVEVPQPAPGRETVVMPDKASADVVMAQPADLVRDASDFVPCTLANSALGQSSLTSRLGVRVRDVEGLTYGIHSSFTAGKIPGPFTVSLTVKPESRDAAVAATLDEIVRFRRTGITPVELAHEKSSRIGKFQVDLASNAGLADAIDAALYYGFGVEYLDTYPSRVEAVTREQANEAFRRRVDPAQFTIVSAGTFAKELEVPRRRERMKARSKRRP